MTALGVALTVLAVLVMMIHEEVQFRVAHFYRWWRRRYRPTRWTTHEQVLLRHSVVRLK